MKKSNSVLVMLALSTIALAGSHNAFAISPPWNILQSEMKATVGADDCVDIDNLKPVPHGYNLDVEVCNTERAKALATLIDPTRDFGGVIVHIRVFAPHHHQVTPGTLPTHPEELEELIQTALCGNRYFVKVAPGNAIVTVFAEFTPSVIQFFADNLADAYNNLNLVAEDAFNNAMGLSEISHGKIGVTTSPIDKQL